jgi:protein-disulfide isomerase
MRILSLVLMVVVLGGIAWGVTANDHSLVPAAAAATAKPSPDAGPMRERSLGPADAPVTIVEYFSLTCPHCAKFEQTTFAQLKADYIDTGKVHYIARDFPFDRPGLHAAMLARCAEPDRYFPLIDLFFKGQEDWATAADQDGAMAPLAKFAGMSDESIKSCLANQDLQNFVVVERKEATEKYKVDSTPTFIFNNGAAQFSGDRPYENFKQTIDSLLAGHTPVDLKENTPAETSPPATP